MGTPTTPTATGEPTVATTEEPEVRQDTLPLDFAIQQENEQLDTRANVVQNVTSPQIPTEAVQSYTGLQTGEVAGGEQFLDTSKQEFFVPDQQDITIAQGTTTPASITQAQAAEYDATTISDQTPAMQAATGAVDKLVDPATGQITQEAVAVEGVVDPNSLVEAAVGDLPEKALMTTQLDNLLKDLEGGQIPGWARPAVDAVDAALAARGMGRSSVGRDSLFNAIIQAALPLAQDNARAEQQRAAQNLQNQQQANLANSQVYQTMALTNLNNKQQTVLQNAAAYAAMDTANLSAAMQAQVENARNFLSMNMQNLTNEQQASLVNQQSRMQSLLSDQAASNAAKQFNASNEQQVNTLMAQLGTQVNMFNSAQADSMSQFNAGQTNAMTQFIEQIAFSRDQFNAQMYSALEQSNVQWRRNINQIDTAGINAVNQANAINAFNLSNQALTLLWSDLRDSASWAFQASETDQERDTRLAIAALANESDKAALEVDTWSAVGGFISRLIG